jgi:hypothetical protein
VTSVLYKTEEGVAYVGLCIADIEIASKPPYNAITPEIETVKMLPRPFLYKPYEAKVEESK